MSDLWQVNIRLRWKAHFPLKSSVALISITLQVLSSNHSQHLSGSVRLRQGLQVFKMTSFSETSYQESSFFTVSSPAPPLSLSTSSSPSYHLHGTLGTCVHSSARIFPAPHSQQQELMSID